MIKLADTCPTCREHTTLAEVHGTWIAACQRECFVGEGEVPGDAIEDWSRRAGAASAPPPSSLASFIVPRHAGDLLVPTQEELICTAPFFECECGLCDHRERRREQSPVDGIHAPDLATANTLATMGREGYAPLPIYWEPRRAPAHPIVTNLPEEIAL